MIYDNFSLGAFKLLCLVFKPLFTKSRSFPEQLWEFSKQLLLSEFEQPIQYYFWRNSTKFGMIYVINVKK